MECRGRASRAPYTAGRTRVADPVLDHRLVIVSGKGGVGKSSVAAGLAILAQRTGRRVLVVELEGSDDLAPIFGVGPLTFHPQEVRPGLHTLRIVRSEALLEYLSLHLRIPGVSRFGAMARAFDALATAAPAVREIITIGKILWEVREERWDLVVVDGPPTGQIGSYLRAPVSISELVPTGRVASQAEWMRAMLADPGITQIMFVALPEELPTTETLETMEWLAKEDLVPEPLVVANRVLPDLGPMGRPTGVQGEIASLHRSLLKEQRSWLERLSPSMRLPYMFGLFTPGEVAAHLSDEMETTL